MSAVARFFVAVSGSFIHERMAQFFVDFYNSGYKSMSVLLFAAINLHNNIETFRIRTES